MEVINLTENPATYTCNAYFVRDEHNPDSKNTLIDTGRDSIIFERLDDIFKYPGKKLIDQIIITHNHYDHTAMLAGLREKYSPKVYAYSRYLKGVDVFLNGGESLLIGEHYFEVIHTPGHTQDSICLYCPDNGYLFVGDTPVILNQTEWSLEDNYVKAMKYLCRKDVSKIFFGHGPPLEEDCNEKLNRTLEIILKNEK